MAMQMMQLVVIGEFIISCIAFQMATKLRLAVAIWLAEERQQES